MQTSDIADMPLPTSLREPIPTLKYLIQGDQRRMSSMSFILNSLMLSSFSTVKLSPAVH